MRFCISLHFQIVVLQQLHEVHRLLHATCRNPLVIFIAYHSRLYTWNLYAKNPYLERYENHVGILYNEDNTLGNLKQVTYNRKCSSCIFPFLKVIIEAGESNFNCSSLSWFAVFGMNVGGVPWTGQDNPELKDGFLNVVLVCVATLVIVLLCFLFPALYSRVAAWRRRPTLRRSWSLNRTRPFVRRSNMELERTGRGYLRL